MNVISSSTILYLNIKLKVGLAKTVTSQKRGKTDNLNIILPNILGSLL
jgi:hypothetical protein